MKKPSSRTTLIDHNRPNLTHIYKRTKFPKIVSELFQCTIPKMLHNSQWQSGCETLGIYTLQNYVLMILCTNPLNVNKPSEDIKGHRGRHTITHNGLCS